MLKKFSFKIVISYLLFSRVTFIIFALIGISAIPLQEGYVGRQFDTASPYLTWIWANFDGRHYLNVASKGYANYDFAFFPFYPLAISLINKIFKIPFLYSGILLSTLSLGMSVYFVYKTVCLDYKAKVAKLTIIYLLFFPLSFFYHSVYPDSLFLLLSTASFYYARSGKWILAGLFGMLTCLTRLSGFSLIPALVVEWFLQNRNIFLWREKLIKSITKKLLPVVVLTGGGLLIYFAYLQIYHGDWQLFQKSMVAWRQDKFILPFVAIYRYLKIFIHVDKSLLVFWIAVLEAASLFVYLGLAWYVLKNVRASYGVFMMVLVSLVTFTGTFAGTPRYILHLFPGFLAISLLSYKKNTVTKIILFLFVLLGLVLTILFTRGRFIA